MTRFARHTPVISPEQILSSADAAPFALPPSPDLFASRSARFAYLAHQQPHAAWLDVLAGLCQAQHEALGRCPADHDAVLPLAATAPLPGQLSDVLQHLVHSLERTHPKQAAPLIAPFRQAVPPAVEPIARSLLTGSGMVQDGAGRSLIEAALQVIWTARARSLPASALQPAAERDLCPCCGTPASTALIRIGGSIAGLRFLHCPLCNTQWNAMRARCTSCESVREVAQHRLDGRTDAPWPSAGAESCDACGSYRKLFNLDKDPAADPVADDLASLALDVLMGEAGLARNGHLPFMELQG